MSRPFKVGDRVRSIGESCEFITQGDEGTVVEVTTSRFGNVPGVWVDWDDSPNDNGSRWFARDANVKRVEDPQ